MSKLEFDLATVQTKEEAVARIEALYIPVFGGTNTAQAMSDVATQILIADGSRGWRGGRTVVVVITDGDTQERAEVFDTRRAVLASKAGVSVSAVGVGPGVTVSSSTTTRDLDDIPSGNGTYFVAATFNELGLLVEAVFNGTVCHGVPGVNQATTTTQTTTTTTTTTRTTTTTTSTAFDFSRCNATLGRWYDNAFNASTWPMAVSHGVGRVAPWGVAPVSNDWHWLWTSDNDGDNHVICRPIGRVNATTSSLTIRLVVDNAFELYVGGERVGSGNNWTRVESVTVAARAGDVIALEAWDIGDAAGFSGVIDGVATAPANWVCIADCMVPTMTTRTTRQTSTTVTTTTTATTGTTTAPSFAWCAVGANVDVVLLLDTSGSIAPYFEQVKAFAVAMVRGLDVGLNATRVAVMTFN